MTTDLSLKVTHHIPASPERVFDAWLTPETLRKFITPDFTLEQADVTLDPREGGRFDIIMKGTERPLPHWGIYKTIDRPRTLVFTWVSEWSLEDSTVTLTFTPSGTGTDVTLVHDRFMNDEMRDNHERGWASILRALSTAEI
ncbi:MAG: SRPBCC domain-containing protein [Pseudomonadota bacterium]